MDIRTIMKWLREHWMSCLFGTFMIISFIEALYYLDPDKVFPKAFQTEIGKIRVGEVELFSQTEDANTHRGFLWMGFAIFWGVLMMIRERKQS